VATAADALAFIYVKAGVPAWIVNIPRRQVEFCGPPADLELVRLALLTPSVLTFVLPASPIITATLAAKLSGRTFAAANNALAQLVDAGILTPSRSARRNRTFEAREVIDAFTSLERSRNVATRLGQNTDDGAKSASKPSLAGDRCNLSCETIVLANNGNARKS